MKNPQEWDENYARTSDRLPHPGWAAWGPYIDKRAQLADRIVWLVSIVAGVAAWWFTR